MIKKLDHNPKLTKAQRLDIVKRCLYASPFFYLLDFEVVTAATKQRQYKAKAEVNKDFYLTEVIGNFGDVFADTTSLFDVSIWDNLNEKTIYKYIRGNLLPSNFIMQDARNNTAFVNQIFCDTQLEYMPKRIKSGNRILAEIRNVTPKVESAEAKIVLKGFSQRPYYYLQEDETEAVNKSVEKETQFDFFKFTVNQDGYKDFVVTNDKKPRLILGFGAVNSVTAKEDISQSEMFIEDLSKGLKLTDTYIPVQFLAPRLTCALDVSRYYLPLEYYFEPFCALRFGVRNVFPNPEEASGYDFYILTRTV